MKKAIAGSQMLHIRMVPSDRAAMPIPDDAYAGKESATERRTSIVRLAAAVAAAFLMLTAPTDALLARSITKTIGTITEILDSPGDGTIGLLCADRIIDSPGEGTTSSYPTVADPEGSADTAYGTETDGSQVASAPKWIIAHKINQLHAPYTRIVTWFPPNHYPGCFGDLGFLGTEDSLDHYFAPDIINPYLYANGIEFDVWYNEPGDSINNYGADQQDIHDKDVVTGQWYVSHEPCDDMHVPLHEYVSYLKRQLDTHGASRVALLYVDMKVIENHSPGAFDPIRQVRDTLRSGLGEHYDSINVLYSTAEWTGRGAFERDNFISTLRQNELIGIDEDNDDAAIEDREAARVAIRWARNNHTPAVYFSDDTDATRKEFIHWKNANNYPAIVGGWTISSDSGTSLDDNDEAHEYWNEGVNLFLIQNYFEGVNGTGAYHFLWDEIDHDEGSHIATGFDRPWLPTADAGGPYWGTEGSTVTFNGSGSTPGDRSTSLQYRWAFSGPGSWGDWSSSPESTYVWDDDISTLVQLEVRDIYSQTVSNSASVLISNVPPSVISVASDVIVENGVASVGGTIFDPGVLDTFTVVIDWGEGYPASYAYPAGVTQFHETHHYLDDNPSGTDSDLYPVAVTVIDDDGGVGMASATVTVHNQAPTASIECIDPAGKAIGKDVDVVLVGLPLDTSISFADVGTRDVHDVALDWGDMSGPLYVASATSPVVSTHTYMNTGTYNVLVTVTDDDTGTATVSEMIDVVDASGAVADAIEDLIDFADDPASDPAAVALALDALGELDGRNGGRANNGALDLLRKADWNAAFVKLARAVALLKEGGRVNEVSQLFLASRSVVAALLRDAEAAASRPGDWAKISAARSLIDQGEQLFASGDVNAAVQALRAVLAGLAGSQRGRKSTA